MSNQNNTFQKNYIKNKTQAQKLYINKTYINQFNKLETTVLNALETMDDLIQGINTNQLLSNVQKETVKTNLNKKSKPYLNNLFGGSKKKVANKKVRKFILDNVEGVIIFQKVVKYIFNQYLMVF